MSTPPRGKALGADAGLLAITAIWGTTFVVVKDALAGADPFTFLALRFALAAVVAAAVAGRALRSREAWRGGALLGVLLFAGFAFQTFGLVSTTPSRSAFLTSLSVALVPFASLALFRRAPGWPTGLGIGVAVAGLFVLTRFELLAPSGLGDLLTLGCAVAFALHIAVTERFASVRPTALVAVQLGVSAVLSAAAIPFGAPRLSPTPAFWAAVVATAVLASALANSVQVWAQARTTAVRAAVIFSLEPVIAAACSAALGREVLGARELLGGSLIVGGVLISEGGTALFRRGDRT